MSIECEICGRSPQTTGDALYRANEKGVEGRWRCKFHLNTQAREIAESETGTLTRIIEEGGRGEEP